MNLKKYRNIYVVLIDMVILISVCSTLFYIFRSNMGIGSSCLKSLLPHIALIIFCESIPQCLLRTYKNLWRYAESKEYLMMSLGFFIGYLVFLLLDYVVFNNQLLKLFSLAACSLSLLGMILIRLMYRYYRNGYKSCKKKSLALNKAHKKNIAIIGAGEAGVKLYEELSSKHFNRYRILFFVDDSIDKIGKQIQSIPVKGPIIKLEEFLTEMPIQEVIIAIPDITTEKKRFLLHICHKMQCKVQILPDILELLQTSKEGTLFKSVMDINMEELLGRNPISLDNKEIKYFLTDKTVMVTGGGGSIGSELCRQIAKINPRKLIIVDNYENNAYEIQQELLYLYGENLNLAIEIASVSDKKSVYNIFKLHHPDIVYHAAAHKHVPLMEDCPWEAIRNNIFGTYYMVLASERYKVQKFILISSDKAVNPTNVMGASKRFCEMILQSRKNISVTEFVAVRFGNVLGSNGSVIPLFQKQIERGGPITITDKRIVRFFMTISEAVQLVLQAGAMGNSADIYVLDMGEPVQIINLAEDMIRLSGYIPYVDIPIVEIGLRPGEKLYEELLMNSGNLIATANHKIFVERQSEIPKMEIKNKMKLLVKALNMSSSEEIKNALKQVVTTYQDAEEVNTGRNNPYKAPKDDSLHVV